MGQRSSRLLISAGCAGLGVLAGLGGLAFLTAAVYTALAHVITPAGAALVVGVAGLLVMVGLIALARRLAAPPPGRGERAPSGDAGVDQIAHLAAALQPLVRGRGKETAAFAFGVGIVLGISPRARRTVWRVARDAVSPPPS